MTSEQTIVLITGANRGIGYSLALNLLQRRTPQNSAYHIILCSRSLSPGLSSASTLSSHPSIPILGTVSAIELDVTSPLSISTAVTHISKKYGRIDILVNNAGVFSKKEDKVEALRDILETNVIGAYAVTEAFLPLPRNGGKRIVFVSSSVGSLSRAFDPESRYYNPGAKEYRCSKAALNMLMVQYWVGLQSEGFKILGANPGLCATDFYDRESVIKRGAVDADVGGERVAVVVRGERDEWCGRVIGEYGASPW